MEKTSSSTRAIEALRDWRETNRADINRRAEVFGAALSGLPEWRIDSIGAYFAYLRHPFRGRSAQEVAERLAVERGVLCLPGIYFGPGQEDHLRVAFANQIPALGQPVAQAVVGADDQALGSVVFSGGHLQHSEQFESKHQGQREADAEDHRALHLGPHAIGMDDLAASRCDAEGHGHDGGGGAGGFVGKGGEGEGAGRGCHEGSTHRLAEMLRHRFSRDDGSRHDFRDDQPRPGPGARCGKT